ncbi:hypothetical protein K457DRAFT_24228 [Linnemannia elongata AG-77]|uniref:F-box domain-containing protein n=1 Tax=Linnemannia elongata AG-77 TaxID=1314771 RepID=A0A197JGU2_9FUNG|nr:hypothetical protein K457DRAFT_24228 [Linnemannia elongata AG-77]
MSTHPAFNSLVGALPLAGEVFLHREATWFLTSPIFECLQSLSIPAFDLDCYSRAMDRLRNLERIHFVFDDSSVVSDFEDDSVGSVSPELSEDAAQASKTNPLRALVTFVKDFSPRFKGRPKTVIWSDSAMRSDVHHIFPLVKIEILQILPPLKSPRFLNKDNFPQCLTHLASTDLAHVQEIVDILTLPNLWFKILCDNRQFLQRASLLSRESRPALTEHELMPLEDVIILGGRERLTTEIDDIPFAFSQTLRKIAVAVEGVFEEILCIGRGWVDLPVLMRLSINANLGRLVPDRDLFRHCPNLQRVLLSDKIKRYRYRGIVTCLPADLSRLESLNLRG